MSSEKNVQPLRTVREIEEMKQALKQTGTERDVFMFTFGINTGLRASDIVKIKVGDVRNKTHFEFKEQKSQKIKGMDVPKSLMAQIEEYTRGKRDEEYLFASRNDGGRAPLSTTQVYRTLQKAAVLLERDDIGTHTMRKTFGFHHYRRFKNVHALKTLLGHTDPEVTLTYIGITDDEIDTSMRDFSL